jgi:hypothetical protein
MVAMSPDMAGFGFKKTQDDQDFLWKITTLAIPP